MKFAINIDHIRYFRENHHILLEELFSQEQVDQLNKAVGAAFTYRLGENWKRQDCDELFEEGRELHASNREVQRLLSQKRIAMIVSQLLDCVPLRLGFDQYLPSNEKKEGGGENPYGEFLRRENTLAELSCVQGIRGGLMICLESPEIEDERGCFAKNRGDAVLFSSDIAVALDFLDAPNRGRYLLATYVDKLAIYIHNDNDPHQHALKRWGYGFGDKLKEPIHPIILKK